MLLLLSLSATSLTLPCSIRGFSVSDRGFAALLSDEPRSRVLATYVAEDTERASSPRALTLLQLLQGIDLGGPSFPPEQLDIVAGAAGHAPGTQLEAVLLEAVDSCSLALGGGAAVECPSAFEAIALSMRYSVPLRADAALLDEHAFPASECDERYPLRFTADDAAQQRSSITKRMAGLPCDIPPEPDRATPPAASGALDLQAFDLSALRKAVDECEPTPPPVAPGLNANSPPPEMLRRVLEIARERGDAAAIEKIEKQLEMQQIKRDLEDRE